MINCCSLKRALFHNIVHLLFVVMPFVALLVFFVCVNHLKGIIIGICDIVLITGCSFPIYKSTVLIIFDLIKGQTISKENCVIKQVEPCYLFTSLISRRAFITDLRPNFINKIDLCLSETINDNHSGNKKYNKVRLYLHEHVLQQTSLGKNLKYDRSQCYSLGRKLEWGVRVVIDVEYYRYSKLIKQFNAYEKRVEGW